KREGSSSGRKRWRTRAGGQNLPQFPQTSEEEGWLTESYCHTRCSDQLVNDQPNRAALAARGGSKKQDSATIREAVTSEEVFRLPEHGDFAQHLLNDAAGEAH